MARNSYIYRILARLAYLQATAAVYQDHASAADLYAWLKTTTEREGPEQRYLPKDAEELKATLRSLEDIGVAQGSTDPAMDHTEKNDSCRWRFAGNLPADLQILRRDGGGGDEPPISDARGGGDDGGGPGGLAQLLAHPVLFALDDGDLDTVLEYSFEAPPKAGGK